MTLANFCPIFDYFCPISRPRIGQKLAKSIKWSGCRANFCPISRPRIGQKLAKTEYGLLF